eukprot:gb/GECG01000650.1/.p1 GENE.gb/GECG01000650.1/~~gb/GECG01000650.1/.p1  ORF type:complete len:554 (+),score=59.68 gb/GECG01000650.1/:1-1662(+)
MEAKSPAPANDGNSYVSRKECHVCGYPLSSCCSRCHQTRYCSRQCQEAHWPFHKQKCIAGGAEQPGPFTAERITETNMVGLHNLGNTCYLSSGLQCLKAVFPLTSYFLSGTFQKDLNTSNPLSTGGQVTLAYVKLLRSMFMDPSSGKAVAPIQLKETVGKHRPALSNFLQQDASEALAFLLDALHEDCNRIKNKPYVEEPDYIDDPRTLLAQAFQLGYGKNQDRSSEGRMKTSMDEALAPVNWKLLHCRKIEFDVPRAREAWERWKRRNDSLVSETVVGQLRSTVTCPPQPAGCGRISTVFDPFTVLSLEIPSPRRGSVTLTDCLEHFMSGEQLDTNNEYFCTACKRHVQANKELTVWRLPKILVVQLKRFSRGHSILARKLSTLVEFPLTGFQVPSFDEYQDQQQSEKNTAEVNAEEDKNEASSDSDSSSSSGDIWGRDAVDRENSDDVLEDINLWARAPQRVYDCFGVVNHFGNMMFGHYTSHINPFVGRFGYPENVPEGRERAWNSWLECDDSHVRPIPTHAANAEEAERQVSRHVVTDAAYILFYRLRD